MKKQYFKTLTIICILISVAYKLEGQGHTMYYMDAVPQSYYFNPATQPKCNFFMGLPALSSTYIYFDNSGFSIDDLIFKDPESDSIISIFHENADVNDFLNQMDDVEQISLNASLSVASFGFRAGNMFFAIDAIIRAEERIYYPKDLFEILLIGPEQNRVYDLSAFGSDILNFSEVGMTISRKFGNYFSLGVRPKFLTGIFTAQTQNSNINLETSSDEWRMNIDAEMMIATSGVTYDVTEDGIFDPGGSFDFENPITKLSSIKNLNNGFGIDLGVHFKPVEELQLSASLLDFGYINWKYNTNIATLSGGYSYQGYNINSADSADFMGGILDSISENITITGVASPFTTYLNPKFIAGGRFFLTKGFDVGLLSKTVFYKQKTEQDFIILANIHPNRMFSLSASYSLNSKTHDIFGLGLGLKLGPLNWYAVADYLPSKRNELVFEDSPIKLPIPVNMYNFNIRLGFNIMFGGKQQKKQTQDLPLFRSTDWVF